MNATHKERLNYIAASTAIELAVQSVMKSLGEDAAKSFQGISLTKEAIAANAAAAITGKIKDQVRG